MESDDLVSMNMLGFTPSIYPYLEEKLVEFLNKNQDDLNSCEFLIPDVLQESINEKILFLISGRIVSILDIFKLILILMLK